MLFECDRVAAGEGNNPLTAAADGKAQELKRDGIHRAVRLDVEDDSHRSHEWVIPAQDIFVSGQKVMAILLHE